MYRSLERQMVNRDGPGQMQVFFQGLEKYVFPYATEFQGLETGAARIVQQVRLLDG